MLIQPKTETRIVVNGNNFSRFCDTIPNIAALAERARVHLDLKNRNLSTLLELGDEIRGLAESLSQASPFNIRSHAEINRAITLSYTIGSAIEEFGNFMRGLDNMARVHLEAGNQERVASLIQLKNMVKDSYDLLYCFNGEFSTALHDHLVENDEIIKGWDYTGRDLDFVVDSLAKGCVLRYRNMLVRPKAGGT